MHRPVLGVRFDSFRHPGPRDTAHTTHRALPVAVLVACLLLTLRIVAIDARGYRRTRRSHATAARPHRLCGRGAAFAQRSGNRAGCRVPVPRLGLGRRGARHRGRRHDSRAPGRCLSGVIPASDRTRSP